MSKVKFYRCERCGNLVEVINASGAPMVCCGEKMKEIIPGAIEASGEKHVPVVNVDGNKVTVTVGSVLHPMSEAHSILWVYLETDKGGQRKDLPVDGEPMVSFLLDDEKPVCVYAYCNLHGLWKTEI